jgi:hypothetical protein
MALLTQLPAREALLMGITAPIATLNWWWAKHREIQPLESFRSGGCRWWFRLNE